MSGNDHSIWHWLDNRVWAWLCSWLAASGARFGLAWCGQSYLNWTPVKQLHIVTTVVASVWTLAVSPAGCCNSTVLTLWVPQSASVTFWSTRRWTWRRRPIWQKHVTEILVTYFILSSESRSMPRSWTTLLGSMLLSPTLREWSMCWRLSRQKRDPNQIKNYNEPSRIFGI